MKISDFLNDINKNCSEIAYLCAVHILEKLYDIETDEIDNAKIIELFEEYSNYTRYLNDYAGTIYRKYQSSIDEVYIELCEYLKIDSHSQYMFEFAISKIEKYSPASLMQIEDDELKILTIEKLEEKLQKALESRYYQENKDILTPRVDKITSNFALVKRALNLNSNY